MLRHRAPRALRSPLLLLVTIAWLSPAAASAQQIEREVQVALDAQRGILEVDARLRAELGLFTEVQGFQFARLFRTAAGDHVLEITWVQQGTLTRERRRLDDAQLAALRSDIQQSLAGTGRERVVEREGRAGLIVGQTVVGLGYHGWAVPTALDIDSDRGAMATYLLTSGASFLIPWLVTQNNPVGVAERDAFFWGATRGILYGHLAGWVAAPGHEPQRFEDQERDERLRLGLGSVGSVLGSLAGFYAARRFEADPGTVALWSAAADFGIASAFGTSYALGLFDAEEVFLGCVGNECSTLVTGSDRDGYALALGLGVASLVGAKLWGDAEDYTVGDARALRSFGLLGTQAVLPIAVEIFDTSDTDDHAERAIAASAVLGGVAGLFVGNRALRRTSLSGGDGLLVLAGHVAGGLAALGVTYLLDSDDEEFEDTLYLATSAAGSAIGSLLTFRAVRGARGPLGSGAAPVQRGRGLGSAQVTVHPTGALAPLLGPGAGSGAVPLAGSPILTVRF